jgi:drug/metabolite transporter (DMT)-like permease
VDPIALALVLVAATFHAGWNRLLHDVSDRIAALSVAGLVGGVLLLPAAITDPPRQVFIFVLLSAVAETAYALFLTAAYRRGTLSLAYPIGRGTAPLVVVLGAWIILAQPPRMAVLLGAAALGTGLAVVALTGEAQARLPAVAFALLTGLSIASYSLIDSQAVRHASPPAYLSLVLILQGLALAAFVRGDITRWRAAARPGGLIGIGSIVAYLLVLFAFQRANPGPVATLRETSVLIGLLLARERPGRLTWIGAGLVVAGALAVAS